MHIRMLSTHIKLRFQQNLLQLLARLVAPDSSSPSSRSRLTPPLLAAATPGQSLSSGGKSIWLARRSRCLALPRARTRDAGRTKHAMVSLLLCIDGQVGLTLSTAVVCVSVRGVRHALQSASDANGPWSRALTIASAMFVLNTCASRPSVTWLIDTGPVSAHTPRATAVSALARSQARTGAQAEGCTAYLCPLPPQPPVWLSRQGPPLAWSALPRW